MTTRVFEITSSLIGGNHKYVDVILEKPSKGEKVWRFQGGSAIKRWRESPPIVKLYEKRRELPDFVRCQTPGALVAFHPIHPLIAGVLEEAGEVLPAVSSDGVDLSIVNLTPAYPCLDEERTKGTRFSDGRLIHAEYLAFTEDKLPDRSLFKPVGYTGILLAVERDGLPADRNFKTIVENTGLTGIDFREIWNSMDGALSRGGMFS